MSYNIYLDKTEDGTYVISSQSKGTLVPDRITISGHVHVGDANDFISVMASNVDGNPYYISAHAQAPLPR